MSIDKRRCHEEYIQSVRAHGHRKVKFTAKWSRGRKDKQGMGGTYSRRTASRAPEASLWLASALSHHTS